MDLENKIQNSIEWANKRLTLQGQELSKEQIEHLTFALSQNFTDNNQALQLIQPDIIYPELKDMENAILTLENGILFSVSTPMLTKDEEKEFCLLLYKWKTNLRNHKKEVVDGMLYELLNAVEGFVSDFEGDYVMPDGRIVDNPNNLLLVNYEVMKNALKKALK